MSTFRNASPQPFSKNIVTKGYGYHTPQDGSVCKIKVFADESEIIIDLDENGEKEIIVGDVDEPVDRIIEDCIRTMKEEEVCRLKFEHPCRQPDLVIPTTEPETASAVENKNTEVLPADEETKDPQEPPDDSIEIESLTPVELETLEENKDESETCENEQVEEPSLVELPNCVEIEFQLISYTREPEIWEMSVTEKWRRASYHKQKGLDLYSRGAYQYAFRRFGLTLKYVISLEHDIPSGQEEGMDIKGLKLSCYLNVAACQMRHYNFESVIINASKALSIQPNNAKALYRRGAAYLQLQEYEKAKEDLTKAQQLEPKNQAVAKQLQLLKCQVQKLNQYYATAMKKLFA